MLHLADCRSLMTSSVNPNDTLGALQVGGTVMVFLFGIETLQTYYYFRRYPNDDLWLKLLVSNLIDTIISFIRC
jgi:hypothetical protein